MKVPWQVTTSMGQSSPVQRNQKLVRHARRTASSTRKGFDDVPLRRPIGIYVIL